MIQIESKTPSENGLGRVQRPDIEVQARPGKPKRRRFSLSFKRAVVAEAEKCTEPGAIGALLRREGLFSSHLSQWRKQAAAGEWSEKSPKRGRRPKGTPSRESQELAQVHRENERLRSQLEQAELIIGAQKKLAQAFESILSQAKDGPAC
jgi:transposase